MQKKKVIVFENLPRHGSEFKRSLEQCGCEVMVFDHFSPRQEAAAIRDFAPEVAVVDSKFKDDLDGLYIVRDLCDLCPGIAIVVCSVLLAAGAPRRKWIAEQYERIEAVRRLLPKEGPGGDILPRAEAILGL